MTALVPRYTRASCQRGRLHFWSLSHITAHTPWSALWRWVRAERAVVLIPESKHAGRKLSVVCMVGQLSAEGELSTSLQIDFVRWGYCTFFYTKVRSVAVVAP